MSRKRKSFITVVSLLLSLLLCLAVAGAGILLFVVPDRASQLFGSPSPNLGLTQDVYLSVRLLLQANDLTIPADIYGEEQDFTVEMGESPAAIAVRLAEQGVIPNARAFRDYLVYRGLDTTLQAGSYRLSPARPALEIAATLQDATPAEVDFVILPGWRLEEIAAGLPTSGLAITQQEFLQVASAPAGSALAAELPPEATLEGFLLPDSYQLERELDARDLVDRFTANFMEQVDAEMREGFAAQGLSLYEAVSLAAIVEREAITDEEMPQIASVFFNRLAAGMKLDSDPTVQYALGYDAEQQTWWTNPLSQQDLGIDSSYNTYLYPGLPPGPIANPSLKAIRAVAFPAQTPYYYFRSRCDDPSKHDFSQTYEEHLGKSCE